MDAACTCRSPVPIAHFILTLDLSEAHGTHCLHFTNEEEAELPDGYTREEKSRLEARSPQISALTPAHSLHGFWGQLLHEGHEAFPVATRTLHPPRAPA